MSLTFQTSTSQNFLLNFADAGMCGQGATLRRECLTFSSLLRSSSSVEYLSCCHVPAVLRRMIFLDIRQDDDDDDAERDMSTSSTIVSLSSSVFALMSIVFIVATTNSLVPLNLSCSPDKDTFIERCHRMPPRSATRIKEAFGTNIPRLKGKTTRSVVFI